MKDKNITRIYIICLLTKQFWRPKDILQGKQKKNTFIILFLKILSFIHKQTNKKHKNKNKQRKQIYNKKVHLLIHSFTIFWVTWITYSHIRKIKPKPSNELFQFFSLIFEKMVEKKVLVIKKGNSRSH